MRNVSADALLAMYAQQTDEVMLTLVELDHPSFPEPTRIVNNDEEIVRNGETYLPFAFETSLPDDASEGIPVMRWQVDNVTGEFIERIRSVSTPITAVVTWVLASSPDVVQAGPIDAELRGVTYDSLTISGTFSLEAILEEPIGFLQMTPATTPGLF